MSSVRENVRTLLDRSREVVHPFMASFLPVSFTDREIARQKKRLDPGSARSCRELQADSRHRLRRIGEVLGLSDAQADACIDEAIHVRLGEATADDTAELASPMCFEDRFAVYMVVRAIKPRVAVETGVANGASTAYLLAAMNANERGCLYSIDISDDERIGQLVPMELRRRWRLLRGDSMSMLPSVLRASHTIDLFLHDSLHHYGHMRREYELAWPYIKRGGLLCSHDILTTNAFSRWVRRHRSQISVSLASVNFGLARKQRGR